MNSKQGLLWGSVALLLVAASAGGYYFFHNFTITKQQAVQLSSQDLALPGQVDTTVVKLYYPAGTRLEMSEKSIPRRSGSNAAAEAIIEEYFKLSANSKGPAIPRNVRLLGIYRDPSQILYIDLSDELRRNFQGDALSEYLLIRGLYESLLSNISDIQDLKLLIEGKELDSLGGHIYLKFPLRNIISYDPKSETAVPDGQ
ncbi:MAG: GerMN domain-containing protein [Thermodesulfovibrionales bacterium]